jgi:hypothetical protein
MTAHNIAFVCCIESGALEDPTIRMIESLRRFGGTLANSQIVAVTPRFGLPLCRSTRAALDRFRVDYLNAWRTSHRYSWFKFLNKPLSLIMAQEIIKAPTICWIDSDIIVVREPAALILNDNEDIVACPADKEMGSAGPGDLFDSIWQAILRANGLSVDSFPWTTTCQEGFRIRLYWNGGIFAFRASSGFAREYLDTTVRSLDARTISRRKDFSLGLNEMSAIGIAAVKLKLRWRELPFAYNYTMGSFLPKEWYNNDLLAAASIIHYHDAMWPHYWSQFMNQMQSAQPAAADWLIQFGPMRNVASVTTRALNKLVRLRRDAHERRHKVTCRDVT